jgi:hypothetical protein
MIAGALGQLLFYLASSISIWDAIGKICGWTLLGTLLGRGVSFFVPNLNPQKAQVGGGIGGFIGAIGFLAGAGVSGDVIGRLFGVALLGFFIGLMVALVEIVYREAWIEVVYGSKEKRTVSLGPEPITIGSSYGACAVYVPDALPVAFRYRLENGCITCEDTSSGEVSSVTPGIPRAIGTVTVTVIVPDQASPFHSQPEAPQSARKGFALNFSAGISIDLKDGATLSGKDIPGLEATSPHTPIAEVNRNPKAPSVMGLKNLSGHTWVAITEAGDRKHVEPGRSIKLTVGTQIDFGSVVGRIS